MTQLSLGESLKRDGLDAVESHDGDWLAKMRAEAMRLSALYGMVTTDDLRMFGAAHGLYPASPNSYGAIFGNKGWKVIGRKRSVIPGNHYREIRVWRYEEMR